MQNLRLQNILVLGKLCKQIKSKILVRPPIINFEYLDLIGSC